MKFFSDGARSNRWFSFAKKKLLAFRSNGKIAGKVFKIGGYTIRLTTATNKAAVTAPPVVIAVQVEYPTGTGTYGTIDNATAVPASELGAIKLYYAEPYGAGAVAHLADTTWDFGNHAVPPVLYSDIKRSTSNPGTGVWNYDAPGDGAIFPLHADFYLWGAGIISQPSGGGVYISETHVDRRYANYAARKFTVSGDYDNLRAVGDATGGCQVGVADRVVSVYGYAGVANYGLHVKSTGIDNEAYYALPLSGILSAAGMSAYTTSIIYGWHAFAHNGKARIAIGITTAPSGTNDMGYYFAELTLNPADGTHSAKWLSWAYIGRCLTKPLGGLWATATPTVDQTFQQRNGSTAWTYAKSNMFSNSLGGVYLILYRPGAASALDRVGTDLLSGGYSFTPGVAAQRNALTFPTGITTAQTWPRTYIGTDTALCVMESIEDELTPPTTAGCHITAIHRGGLVWTALPLPSGTLLTVRPVLVSAARTALIGLVWVIDANPALQGTFFCTFDTSKDVLNWTIYGRISPTRLTRPLVSVFGDHEYAKLIREFPGSFPLTSWRGTHAYQGN